MTELVISNETESGSTATISPFTPKRDRGPAYRARLMEAMQLYGRAMNGNEYAMLQLREAFSTSDFPLLFGDILSRELLPA
jgi:hypothetical protein